MPLDQNSQKILAVSKGPGVGDLPLKVRAPFAKALLAEERGDKAEAEEFLAKAIAAEEQGD